ncbi:ISMsm5, transposase, partial [mine drainage metagenome]
MEEDDPSKHGFAVTMWDTSSLHAHFAAKGMIVSRGTLRRKLLELGGRYVKAVHEYAEADIKKQLAFARKTLKTAKSADDDAVILFEDEMSAGGSLRKGYGWTLDERLVIKAPAYHMKRTNCFGAVSPLTGDIVQSSSVSAKTPAFIRFLDKIVRRFAGKKILLFMDNFRVHSSGRIKRFLKRHPNIEVRFMPPYSPWLNPQEYWWGYLRRKLLNNRFFRSARQMVAAISRFIGSMTAEEVMSVCSL